MSEMTGSRPALRPSREPTDEFVTGSQVRYRRALESAALEGRNVLPGATDDQASVIETWAEAVLGSDICQTPQCRHPESDHLPAETAGVLRQGRTCHWRSATTSHRCHCTGYRGWKP